MIKNTKKVITRFAPSPTGLLHIGSVRTALFNFIYAKQLRGQCILRIEDTDKARSKKEYEDDILDGLKWLGLKHDAFFRQSEREKIYTGYLEKMIDTGKAYISKEELKDGSGQGEVIRFRNPNKIVEFDDIVRGKVEMDTTDLKDFVIAKSITEPLYHLAVVIDDNDMDVTHVIRGEDHISNTPRQILLQEAIGAARPTYAHLPLILAADRSKLSKRKHGESVSLTHYRNKGYLPEAIINFLALIGWNPGTYRELFSLEDLIEEFDLSKVQKGGAIFSTEKLDWLNREHIKRMPEKAFMIVVKEVYNEASTEIIEKIIPLIKERITTLKDIGTMKESGEFDYMFKTPEYSKDNLGWKGNTDFKTIKKYMEDIKKLLEILPETEFTKKKVKEVIWPYAEKEGRGNVLWALRVALSGKEKSPDPFQLAELLGKANVLKYLTHAEKMLS